MTPPLTAVLQRRSDVRFRRVGDESVVVKQRAGEVLVLNGVGGRILELIDGIRPLAELAGALEREFDVDPETLEREVLRFAAELFEAEIVELVTDGGERA